MTGNARLFMPFLQTEETWQSQSPKWLQEWCHYDPPPLRDSSPDDGEARNDFWCISGIFFTVITLNRESNCTCREKHHFLFHWNTSTWPGPQVHHGEVYRRLLERWWRSRIVKNVDRFHAIHCIEWKPPDGYTWSWERLTKSKRPPGQTLCGQHFGKVCRKRRSGEKSRSGLLKNRSLIMLELCVVFPPLIPRMQSSKKLQRCA